MQTGTKKQNKTVKKKATKKKATKSKGLGDTIAKVTDLGIQRTTTPVSGIVARGVYDAKSNPTVARLSLLDTDVGLSLTETNPNQGAGGAPIYKNVLSCYEIKPPESRLEIYWETSTCGLISDLNSLIELGGNASEVAPVPEPVPE